METLEILIEEIAHTVSMDVAAEILRLELEVMEHEQLFSLQWKADMRAIKMWQKANPGNDLVWPDSAKLSVWLMDQLFGIRTSLLGLKYLCAGDHGGYTETTKRKIEYEIEQACNEFAPKPSVNGVQKDGN